MFNDALAVEIYSTYENKRIWEAEIFTPEFNLALGREIISLILPRPAAKYT